MGRFLLLYGGPATPADASHEGWPEWFGQLGDALVDRGSPIADGVVVRGDGTTTGEATSFNGYSVIEAENRSAALALVRDHPLLQLGQEYSIEVFDLPS